MHDLYNSEKRERIKTGPLSSAKCRLMKEAEVWELSVRRPTMAFAQDRGVSQDMGHEVLNWECSKQTPVSWPPS
jgi:hypothetical protein